MSDPLTTQYTVLAERRLHFGRMYWQNIGLLCIGLVIAAGVFRGLTGVWLGVALAIAGGATLLMAFIAMRLRGLEVAYEILLRNIEDAWIAAGVVHIQRAPVSGSTGARYAVNVALAATGAALIAAGINVLLAAAR